MRVPLSPEAISEFDSARLFSYGEPVSAAAACGFMQGGWDFNPHFGWLRSAE